MNIYTTLGDGHIAEVGDYVFWLEGYHNPYKVLNIGSDPCLQNHIEIEANDKLQTYHIHPSKLKLAYRASLLGDDIFLPVHTTPPTMFIQLIDPHPVQAMYQLCDRNLHRINSVDAAPIIAQIIADWADCTLEKDRDELSFIENYLAKGYPIHTLYDYELVTLWVDSDWAKKNHLKVLLDFFEVGHVADTAMPETLANIDCYTSLTPVSFEAHHLINLWKLLNRTEKGLITDPLVDLINPLSTIFFPHSEKTPEILREWQALTMMLDRAFIN